MELIFTSADGTTEVIPGHSLILGMWSIVMRGAIEADRKRGSNNKIRIPMTGTSKEDWLTVMEFLYPVVPATEAVPSWDNLEVLLAVADKYSMPALIRRVEAYLQSNMSQLNYNSQGNRYIWKWLYAADRYGLFNFAKQCISDQQNLDSLVQSWARYQQGDNNTSHQLSMELMHYMLKVIGTEAMVIRRSLPFCPECRSPYEDAQEGDECPNCDVSLILV